jgi:hypothetical protein
MARALTSDEIARCEKFATMSPIYISSIVGPAMRFKAPRLIGLAKIIGVACMTDSHAMKATLREVEPWELDAFEDLLASNPHIAKMTYVERLFRANMLVEDWKFVLKGEQVTISAALKLYMHERDAKLDIALKN